MPLVEPETLKLEAAAVSGTSALQSIVNFIKNLSENLSTPKITAGDCMKAPEPPATAHYLYYQH